MQLPKAKNTDPLDFPDDGHIMIHVPAKILPRPDRAALYTTVSLTFPFPSFRKNVLKILVPEDLESQLRELL